MLGRAMSMFWVRLDGRMRHHLAPEAAATTAATTAASRLFRKMDGLTRFGFYQLKERNGSRYDAAVAISVARAMGSNSADPSLAVKPSRSTSLSTTRPLPQPPQSLIRCSTRRCEPVLRRVTSHNPRVRLLPSPRRTRRLAAAFHAWAFRSSLGPCDPHCLCLLLGASGPVKLAKKEPGAKATSPSTTAAPKVWVLLASRETT
jgi:hypothetical protein